MTRTNISDEVLDSLDLLSFNAGENPYEGDSALRGFPQPADYYRGELARFGFTGQDRVLDLLCGFGRWSLFLAEANGQVVGLDRNAGCIRIAQGLTDHFGLTNASFESGDAAETKRYGDASFDAVWIWNALIYVDRGSCLNEVSRVLKPGGRLLVGNMNSTGRLLQKLRFGLTGLGKRHRAHRKQAIQALRRGPLYAGRPNYATVATAGSIFGAHGFDVVEIECLRKKVLGRYPEAINVLVAKRSD